MAIFTNKKYPELEVLEIGKIVEKKGENIGEKKGGKKMGINKLNNDYDNYNDNTKSRINNGKTNSIKISSDNNNFHMHPSVVIKRLEYMNIYVRPVYVSKVSVDVWIYEYVFVYVYMNMSMYEYVSI